MPTAMVISPHADDAAAFCGGTIAKFTDQGWNIILMRVTDDRKDSVGLSIEETISRNTEELHQAASILGVHEVVELGFETDVLADIPLGRLRERIVYLFRKYRPFAVFTFDPFGLYENNQDHVRVAQAVHEAFSVSCFDKHYPEHFEEGLEPFSVCVALVLCPPAAQSDALWWTGKVVLRTPRTKIQTPTKFFSARSTGPRARSSATWCTST